MPKTMALLRALSYVVDMSGFKLRALGAGTIMVGLVSLLSGWSVLFSPEGAVATIVQFALLATGLILVYRGENPPSQVTGADE